MTPFLFRVAGRVGAATLALAALSLPMAVHAAKPAAKVSATRAPPSKHPSKAKPPSTAETAPPAMPDEPPPPLAGPAGRLAAWIAASHDNGALPYIIIDKQAAELFLFAADGTQLGHTPVLIGIGVGDDSSPGVGTKKSLAEIGPAERTTPAGRFVARFGKAFGHERVLWVDYADSVALHAVITTNPKEHRVERLLTPTPDDNRISFGCINVGTSFYTRQVRPLFQKTGGVVYILPDTKAVEDVFPNVRLLPYIKSGPAQVAATGS